MNDNDNRNDHYRQPSNGTLFARGLVGRCPACGQGRLFRWWVTMVDDCPRCGLHFERIEGHWIGAIGFNTIVSFGTLLITLAVSLIATFPDFPVRTLVIINVAVIVIMPIFFQPLSRTLWTAMDIVMRHLEPHEVDWTKVSPGVESVDSDGDQTNSGTSAR